MSYMIGKADLTKGMPKLCIPIMGKDAEEIRNACAALAGQPCDLVEWRIDSLHSLSEKDNALCALRAAMPEVPLLMTFRTTREGGAMALPETDYFCLLRWMADTGEADAIDIEYASEAEGRDKAAAYAQSKGIPVIMSNHDFQSTPPAAEMTARLAAMQKNGAIAKLAVMAHTPADVLALLAATADIRSRHPERPVITMAMGPLGAVTRTAGEIFGSALTFAASGAVSAPGQLGAKETKTILTIYHEAVIRAEN